MNVIIFAKIIMAKNFKYIFLFLSAAYFLFAGSGYNIVKYCCNGCKMQNAVTTEPLLCKNTDTPKVESCCEHNEPIPENLGSVLTVNQHADKCFFMRVTVDIPLIQTFNVIPDYSVKYIDLLFPIRHDLKIKRQLVSQNMYPPPDQLFPLSGREILSLKAVLII